MITDKNYKEHKAEFWEGRKVETRVDIENGHITIPSGTILEITRKFSGFDLEGLEVCQHCKIGVKIFIRQVTPSKLRLLPVKELKKK